MAQETLNTTALTTVDRVVAELELDQEHNQEVEITVRINAVSARLHTACGRIFKSDTYTHDGTTLPRLRPDHATLLYLPNMPVTSVTSLKPTTDDTALTLSTDGKDEDFIIHEDRGVVELINGNAFSHFRQPVVEITYVGGYVAVADQSSPTEQEIRWGYEIKAADVEEAVVLQSAHEWRRRRNKREGITSTTTEGTTVQYDAAAWVPVAREVIKKYGGPIMAVV